MDIWIVLVALLVGALLGSLGTLALRRTTDPAVAVALSARADDQAVLRDGIDRLHEQLREADRQRASWQGQFHQQVEDMRHANDQLRRETGALSTALRKPHQRGRWGEQHLRRVVESAGMQAYCDFNEQVTLSDGQRPDLVVHLAGEGHIVVDSKVPLDAYLDATGAEDEAEQQAHLDRHVRQVRRHISDLSAKRYWHKTDGSPEFVVLFIATESALSAALQHDHDLLEHAASKNVVLASPTTLIGLLRTIAQGWATVTLAENTREIHELGRLLHERLCTMGSHLDQLGKSLTNATLAYNKTIGSLESRVLVSARQFEDLHVTTDALPRSQPVTEPMRRLSAGELLDDVG